jgi:hypothetical protein
LRVHDENTTEGKKRRPLRMNNAQRSKNYFFNRFSLCFLLFSSLSFLVIGFFLLAPVLNAITTLK